MCTLFGSYMITIALGVLFGRSGRDSKAYAFLNG
jgi:hypothetical protein